MRFAHLSIFRSSKFVKRDKTPEGCDALGNLDSTTSECNRDLASPSCYLSSEDEHPVSGVEKHRGYDGRMEPRREVTPPSATLTWHSRLRLNGRQPASTPPSRWVTPNSRYSLHGGSPYVENNRPSGPREKQPPGRRHLPHTTTPPQTNTQTQPQ